MWRLYPTRITTSFVFVWDNKSFWPLIRRVSVCDDLMFNVYNSLVVLRNNSFRTLNLVTKRGNSRSVSDPGFSSRGCNPHRGCANLFLPKTAWKWKNLHQESPQCWWQQWIFCKMVNNRQDFFPICFNILRIIWRENTSQLRIIGNVNDLVHG